MDSMGNGSNFTGRSKEGIPGTVYVREEPTEDQDFWIRIEGELINIPNSKRSVEDLLEYIENYYADAAESEGKPRFMERA
jgi:hypothetical protein